MNFTRFEDDADRALFEGTQRLMQPVCDQVAPGYRLTDMNVRRDLTTGQLNIHLVLNPIEKYDGPSLMRAMQRARWARF